MIGLIGVSTSPKNLKFVIINKITVVKQNIIFGD